MSDATVFVAMAFAIVWMKRKDRWSLFFKALEGTIGLPTSPQAAAAPVTSGTTTLNTNTNPGPGTGQLSPGNPVQPI